MQIFFCGRGMHARGQARANRAARLLLQAGKMAALWIPITAFVALGLEHCVANMFLVPLGMLCAVLGRGTRSFPRRLYQN